MFITKWAKQCAKDNKEICLAIKATETVLRSKQGKLEPEFMLLNENERGRNACMFDSSRNNLQCIALDLCSAHLKIKSFSTCNFKLDCLTCRK